MKVSLKKILLFLIVVIWLIIIFMFSAMDSDSSNSKSEKTINKVVETTLKTTNNLGITDKHPSATKMHEFVSNINIPLRKCMHAFVYFILVIIILKALELRFIKNYKLYLISFFLCFLFALLDEYHQTFVDGRTGQFTDVLIDLSGSIVGILFYYYLQKFIIFLKKRQKTT